MADLINGDWRIRRGTYTQLQLTAAYNVVAFPLQSDQRKRWFRPVDPSAGFSRDAELVDAFDGTRGGYGGMEFAWTFTMLTPRMVYYLWTTLFDEQYNNTFTVMTWDRAYGWQIVNCTGIWNDPAKDADQPGGWEGYDRLTINFIDGILAESGNGLNLENGLALQLQDGNYLDLE